MSVRLYAFVSPAPAGLLVGLTGVDAEPLTLVRAHRIAAVIGVCSTDAPIDVVSRRALQRHDRLVRALANRATAVLPARFGVRTARRGDVREFIRGGHRVLRSALELVRNREQMTVRIVRRTAIRPAVAARPTSAAPGRAYLLSRVTQPLSVLPELRAAAALWAEHVRAERGQRSRQAALLTIFHLIDRGTGPAYRRVLRKAAATVPDLELRVSGPFPAYAFTPWL